MNKDKEVSSIESALDFIDEYIKENAVQVRTSNEDNKEDSKSNFRIIKQDKSDDVKEVEPKKNKDKKFIKKVDPETKIKKDIKNKYKDDQELNDLKRDERRIQRNDNFDGRVNKDGAFSNYTGSKFVSTKSDLYNDLSGKEAKRINKETKDKLDDDVKKKALKKIKQ